MILDNYDIYYVFYKLFLRSLIKAYLEGGMEGVRERGGRGRRTRPNFVTPSGGVREG